MRIHQNFYIFPSINKLLLNKFAFPKNNNSLPSRIFKEIMPRKRTKYISDEMLANAVKWSKPGLIKKYLYKPRKFKINDDESKELFNEYKKLKSSTKTKLIDVDIKDNNNNDDSIDKLLSNNDTKFSKNDPIKLNESNINFINKMNKLSESKNVKLSNLDELTWKSISTFNMSDFDNDITNNIMGGIEEISSNEFFSKIDKNSLNIEDMDVSKYCNNDINNGNNKWNDNIGFDKDDHKLNSINIGYDLNRLLSILGINNKKKDKKYLNKNITNAELEVLLDKFFKLDLGDNVLKLKQQYKDVYVKRLNQKNSDNNRGIKRRKLNDNSVAKNEFRGQINGICNGSIDIKVCDKNWRFGGKKLHQKIINNLSILGFENPTDIQKEVIPNGLEYGNDILIAAETGSGKTLAFGIPIINDLLNNIEYIKCHLYGLIITPTRELAIQIESHLNAIIKTTQLHVCSLVGGLSIEKQKRLLVTSPEIIVATPGRIWNIIENGFSMHVRNMKHLRYLVLDEADRLLMSNHFVEIKYILNIINYVWTTNARKAKIDTKISDFIEDNISNDDINQKNQFKWMRQMYIVSATLNLNNSNRNIKGGNNVYENMLNIIPFKRGNKPIICDLTPKHKVNINVKEWFIPTDFNDKDGMLYYLIKSFKGRLLVFCNTIGVVKRLKMLLDELNVSNVLSIYSHQKQKQRLKKLDKIVKHNNCVLISTDVCARGLDITNIDNIIHYQTPLCCEDYIHRTGRVARGININNDDNNKYNSFLIVSGNETALYQNIITALNKNNGLKQYNINEKLFSSIKDVVKISQQLVTLLLKQNKVKRKESEIVRWAKACDITLDEINCKALKIKKTTNNKTKRKRNSNVPQYNPNSNEIDSIYKNDINKLRNKLHDSMTNIMFNHSKSKYLTKMKM